MSFSGNFANSKREGDSVDYWENGKVQSKTTYRANMVNGPIHVYSKKGTLVYHADVLNGIPICIHFCNKNHMKTVSISGLVIVIP
jgi:antitoxin component YwqK of YwqJK toxin-antitoxin module